MHFSCPWEVTTMCTTQFLEVELWKSFAKALRRLNILLASTNNRKEIIILIIYNSLVNLVFVYIHDSKENYGRRNRPLESSCIFWSRTKVNHSEIILRNIFLIPNCFGSYTNWTIRLLSNLYFFVYSLLTNR